MNEIPKGVVLSCNGQKISPNEFNFFSKIKPFGFILFKRNFKSKKQIKNLISDLKSISLNKNLQIFVDHEGGRVQRFNNEEFSTIPPQKIFGDIFKINPKKAKNLAFLYSKLMGVELKEIGVDVNCSPVLDVFFDFGDDIIGDRSFSENPEIVTELAKLYCDGMKDSGIFPVLKHFPGHGRAKCDSHKMLPVISASLKDLEEKDLMPYKTLKDENFLMLAHILYSRLDKKVAPYSKVIIEKILNKMINYQGFILSDDLDMKALEGNIHSKAKNCYKGGCDILLYCSGVLSDMKKIYNISKSLCKKKFEFFLRSKSDKKSNASIKKNLTEQIERINQID